MLHKYYNKIIIKPSFLISKFNKIIKIYFYKIGSFIGILFEKIFFATCKLGKYLNYYFNNLWYCLKNFGNYYIINFFSDIIDTSIEIGKPIFELLVSPTEILIGYYNKLIFS